MKWTFLQHDRSYVREDGQVITEEEFNRNVMALNANHLKQEEGEKILDAIVLKRKKLKKVKK